MANPVDALPATPIPESTVERLAENERIGMAKPVAYHYFPDAGGDEDLVSAFVLGIGGEYHPLGFDRREEEWRVVAEASDDEGVATEAVREWQEEYYGIGN